MASNIICTGPLVQVRCVAAGVGLAELERHLDRRALHLKRRPGNAKAYRIAQGNAILAVAKA